MDHRIERIIADRRAGVKIAATAAASTPPCGSPTSSYRVLRKPNN